MANSSSSDVTTKRYPWYSFVTRLLPRSRSTNAETELTREIQNVGSGVLVALFVGLLLLGFSQGGFWPLPLLLGLGLFLVGALVGFLFGIPRVTTNAPDDRGAEVGDANARRPILSVNTNLEQISDWLTKIIVGLGLVEMRKIPISVSAFATVIGPAFRSSPMVAAIAVSIYFPVLGFTSGYLITRLYLSGLIGRADIQLENFKKTKSDVTKLVSAASAATLRKDDHEPTRGETEIASQKAASLVQRVVTPQNVHAFRAGSILWVDDRPANNSSLIEAFRRLGISVDLSLSTEDALAKLSSGQRYDAIVSDMRRTGDALAGLTLLKALRERGIQIPKLIYAGLTSDQHRREAITAGATDYTNNPDRVFEFVTEAVSHTK
jgi:CheY-like chemotaxis protein